MYRFLQKQSNNWTVCSQFLTVWYARQKNDMLTYSKDSTMKCKKCHSLLQSQVFLIETTHQELVGGSETALMTTKKQSQDS